MGHNYLLKEFAHHLRQCGFNGPNARLQKLGARITEIYRKANK